MCGICGFTGENDHGTIRKMTKILAHRGPDDEGYYEDGDISLGVRRLSIVDVQKGHQPIHDEDSKTWCILNGEIYNYRELRRQLESAGHSFNSDSDTETVVHAYEEFGLHFVDHLQGMFALAVWDLAERRLVLARDRVGMKPLYYSRTETGLTFASEVKAILCHPMVQRVANRQVLRLILDFGYSPDNRTPFERVFKLPPGFLLVEKDGKSNSTPYWMPPICSSLRKDPVEAAQMVKSLLASSVQSHLMGEVPLGVMLSGGLDSSSIAYFASRSSEAALQSFTFGYEEEPESIDLRNARIVAEALGTNHHELLVSGHEISKLLPETIYYHDEPKIDPASIPTFAVSRLIRPYAKVVLVGEGSDEQLGGYDSHRYFARFRSFRRLPISRSFVRFTIRVLDNFPRLRWLCRPTDLLGSLKDQERCLRIFNYQVFSETDFLLLSSAEFRAESISTEPASIYNPSLERIGHRDELAPLYVDLATYIPNDISMRVDKMTMASSVEARMPFLHVPFLEYSPSIDPRIKTKWGVSKFILRMAMKNLLPPRIVRAKKRGIRAPVARWVIENSELFANILDGSTTRRRGLFDPESVNKIARRTRSEKDSIAAQQLFGLCVFELWSRLYIDSERWPPRINGITWD